MVIWAGIAGYLFWDEIPTVWIAVGGTAVMVRPIQARSDGNVVAGNIAMWGRG